MAKYTLSLCSVVKYYFSIYFVLSFRYFNYFKYYVQTVFTAQLIYINIISRCVYI